jgi:hypothetical protein
MRDTILRGIRNERDLDVVGGNLAITFINTRRMVEEQLTDPLQSDSDVKAWLKRLEVPIAKGALSFREGVLLQKAREFREIALGGRERSKVREEALARRAQQISGECSESCGAYDRRRQGPSCDSCLRQRDGRSVPCSGRRSGCRSASERRLRSHPSLRRQGSRPVVL